MRVDRLLWNLFFLAVLVGVATPALAIAPSWMPGFPMRMGTNVMLMWTPVPGATAYNVYKSGKDGDLGQKLTSLPMNNHMDMNVPVDASAFYVVKAVVGGAETAEPSAVGKVIGIKPLDATKWLGHMDGEGSVTLRFDAVPGAAFYNVFKAEAENGPFALMGSIQETKYTDTNITLNKEYFYQVSAVDKNSMESPKSPVYKYKYEKKAEAAAAKSWKQVDRVVKVLDEIYGPDERPLVAPSWLATDGTYLVVCDSKGVAIFEENGTLVRDLRKPDNYSGQWGIARGVAATSDGNIIVAFTEPSIIRVMDPNDGNVLREFEPQKPEGKYGVNPKALAEDGAGNIWMTDPVNGMIHVYGARGELVKFIGQPGVSTFNEMDMKFLSLIAYHKPTNRMYVVDPTVRYVRAFDAATMDFIVGEEGKPFYGWRRSGTNVGSTQEVRGIAVLDDGSILLSDGLDGRQQVFAPNMDYISTLVDTPGEKKPSGVDAPASAVYINGKVFISQPLFNKISVLDVSGK